MSVEALLLSRDAVVLDGLRRVLDELNVVVQVANAAHEAAELIGQRKFDALILDCDDVDGATDLLAQLRKGAANRAAIVFAMIGGKTSVRQAFNLGANFVMEKPISYERAARSFRAAHGLMLRERRRYFRHAVDIPVTLSFPDFGDGISATIENLSEGGLAIRTRGETPVQNGCVKLNFTLPGREHLMDVKGEVAWAVPDGRAGIRFLYMNDRSRRELDNWLAESIQSEEPAPLVVNTVRGWAKLGA
jgi:DNA-binding response OmpR family regulator